MLISYQLIHYQSFGCADLMFMSTHLIFQLFFTTALIVFISTRFLYAPPLFTLIVISLGGQGTEVPQIGLLAGNCPFGSAGNCVGLCLCLLALTLGCHRFGTKINLARLLGMTPALSNVGWRLSLLIRTGLPQKICQYIRIHIQLSKSTSYHCVLDLYGVKNS